MEYFKIVGLDNFYWNIFQIFLLKHLINQICLWLTRFHAIYSLTTICNAFYTNKTGLVEMYHNLVTPQLYIGQS